ncbi:MFS transporter [Micromonospora echinospora]|uniref:MFS transporter n=1 Tax=Micromonospora echinospora TaxID=1877 RepID=UPI0033E5C7DB
MTAWRDPDFRRLWAGQGVSYLGSQVSVVALPLTAAAVLHAGPLHMGVLAALSRAPYLLLGLVVGVWVDRLPRRPALVAVNLALAVVLAVVPAGALLGWLGLPQLYAVTFVAGSFAVFLDVAHLAYVPTLVPAHRRTGAQSLVEVTQSTGQLGGPALAGWLVQVLTAPVAVAVDALSHLVAAGSVLAIRHRAPRPAGPAPGLLTAVRAGLRVVFGEPVLRAVTLATATLVFWASGSSALLVLHLLRERNLAPWLLGVTLGAAAVGGLLGAVVAAPLGRRLGSGPTMAYALLVGGLGAGLTPMAEWVPGWAAFTLVLTSQVVTGFGQQVHHVHQVPIRYALTPDHLHGRVNATIRTVVWGSAPVGALLAGWLAQHWGTTPVLALGAVGMATAAAWIVGSPARRVRHDADLRPAGR